MLSVSWQGGTQTYFAGTADGSVWMSDIGMNRKTLVGKHQGGCKEVLWAPSLGVLFSGGWDNMLYIWDVRNQGNAAMEITKKILGKQSTNNNQENEEEGNTFNQFQDLKIKMTFEDDNPKEEQKEEANAGGDEQFYYNDIQEIPKEDLKWKENLTKKKKIFQRQMILMNMDKD